MEKQYYRTFVGIPIRPGPGLLAVRNELKTSLAGERISWVSPELFHVTLRFIGDTARDDLEAIRESLKTRIRLPEVTTLKLQGVASFGPRKKPRVIWAGFQEMELLQDLHKEVNLALLACGIAQVDLPYHPHLTLGRVRSLKDPVHFEESIRRLSPALEETVLLDKMVYFRSELGRGGPSYSALEAYSFA